MKILMSLLFALVGFSVNAQQAGYDLKHYNVKKGLAIEGYDPVAYFTESKAVEGKSAISHTVNGVTYRFSTESNKKLFVADPYKYQPAYGGYCAYAMAFGDKVKVDPETFKVKGGKLFLFYNFNWNNTLKKWNKDEGNLYSKAEESWKKIIE